MNKVFKVTELMGLTEGLAPGFYFIDPMEELQGPFPSLVKAEEVRGLFIQLTNQLKRFYD